jgi:hypothetical protein
MPSMNNDGSEVLIFNNCFNAGVEEFWHSYSIHLSPNPAIGTETFQIPLNKVPALAHTNALGQEFSPPFTSAGDQLVMEFGGLAKGICVKQIHPGAQMWAAGTVIE